MAIWMMLVMAPPALASVVFLMRAWRQRPADRVAVFGAGDAVVAGLIGVWLLSLIVSAPEEPAKITGNAILGSAVVYVGMVVMIGMLLVMRGVPLNLAMGLGPGVPGTATFVVAASVLTLPLVIFVQAVAGLVMGEAGGTQPILEFWIGEAGLWGRVLVVGMASVVAPVCEEWIFRGYLYGVVRMYAGPFWGMFVVSLLFAGIHLHLPAMPGLFVVGVVLTVVYERTGTLLAPIVVHAVFNTLSLVFSLIWPELA